MDQFSQPNSEAALVYSDFRYARIHHLATLTPGNRFLVGRRNSPDSRPTYSIQLTNGKQIKVSDYRGKVLCLTFILTTCPHCQKTTQLWDELLSGAGTQRLCGSGSGDE